MIKKIMLPLEGVETEMLYCDHCGEGIARQEDNNPDVQVFISVHSNCTKPRNKKLNFLNKAEPLV